MNIGKQASEFTSKLAIIRNEIIELDDNQVLAPLAVTDSITPEKFSGRVSELAKQHLQNLQHYYLTRKNLLRKHLDNKVFMLNQQNGKNFLFDLKQKYNNLAIENLALNAGSKEYFRETRTGLMQKVAPVYKIPDFNSGRAHFMASEKRVFSLSINTLAFNILIIWLMSVFLYAALYFNWLRKIISK